MLTGINRGGIWLGVSWVLTPEERQALARSRSMALVRPSMMPLE